METRPTSRPLSTTGMWRNWRIVISDISRSLVSASRAVTTVLAMKSLRLASAWLGRNTSLT
jgi:hypothetical protein